jgi:hypothetical protein
MDWISYSLIVGLALTALVVAVGLAWKPLRVSFERTEAERAKREFRLQREVLEAKFFDLAAAQKKPRGLRWVECEWLDEVAFGRDRRTRMLTAFAAVNIRFEAIEGGDMEDVAAVGNIRDAAAVFHYQAGRWGTGGRALFNMNPHDALARLESQQLEPLG